jgi:Flp pilus assembly protein TadD
MNSKFVVKLALTAAFLTVPTIGGMTLGVSSTMKSSPSSATAKKAHSWARKAEKAVAKGKLDKALMFAELAAEGDFLNPDYRGLLARIYMAQGRFQSAERTYMDLMDLGQTDPRTVISLALTRIAQGKVDSAIGLVNANRAILPASDYGLTLALAGKSDEAVVVLSDAIRDSNATARTRQNLALAYAMNGRWREARIMAVQDMAQDRVNERIAEWAQYARPGAYENRIAGLLKVTPRQDPGQPVRLALANNPASLAFVQPAETAAIANSQPAARQNAELAAIGPAPVSLLKGFDAPEQQTFKLPAAVRAASIQQIDIPASDSKAPLIAAPGGPVKTAGLAVPIAAPKAAPTLAPKLALKLAPKLALADVEPAPRAPRAVGGSHLVQLGAFSTSANAKKAWEQLTNRHSVLTGFNSASSTVTINGKTLIRLAAMGFGNQKAASDVCNSIRAKGGSCIVRSLGAAAPVRLASR